MRVRLLLAIAVLFAWGCTRQRAHLLTRDLSGSGSYQIGDKAVSCRVGVSAGTIETNTESLEGISITLIADTPAAKEYPALIIDFDKPAGQPDAAYRVAVVTYIPGRGEPINSYNNVVGALTEIRPGVFAGTFADTLLEDHPITQGTFTGARLKRPFDHR